MDDDLVLNLGIVMVFLQLGQGPFLPANLSATLTVSGSRGR